MNAHSYPDARQHRPRRIAIRLVAGSSADSTATTSFLTRTAAIAIGVALSAAFLASQSPEGTELWQTVWISTFGSPYGLTQIGRLATTLIIAGTAVSIARRIGLWNVGVEGQIVMGAFAATVLAFAMPQIPGPLLIPLMFLSGLLGGVLWMLIPALGRAYLNLNEVITGLMLNFVAALWLIYWATGPFGNPFGTAVAQSRPIPPQAQLPHFEIASIDVGLGLFIAVIASVGIGAALRYTHYGFRMLLLGGDDRTSIYLGANLRRMQLTVLLLSGAIGGLAGVVAELDYVHRFSSSLSFNTGYLGIVVAVLAGRSIAACIPAGFLFSIIVATGDSLRLSGISFNVVLFIFGLLLLLIAMADRLSRYRLRIVRTIPEEALVEPSAHAHGDSPHRASGSVR